MTPNIKGTQKMNEQIIIVKGAFDLEFCNRCFAITASEKGLVGAEELNANVRKSRITFLQGVFKHLDIYKPVLDVLHSTNQQFFNFDLEAIQAPQLTEYDSAYAGEYKPHKDIEPSDVNGVQRKLSMVVQLTPENNYEGGELQFPESSDYDVSITKEQGTAIIFPSYLLHGVTPVTKGLRKSLVVWAIGSTFR